MGVQDLVPSVQAGGASPDGSRDAKLLAFDGLFMARMLPGQVTPNNIDRRDYHTHDNRFFLIPSKQAS
jgi:hypothetical protein